jgi:ankyrin repeat protein
MDNPYMIELFCDTGVDLSTLNPDGHTPLMYAAYNGYNETVNHLTFRTKNIDVEDRNGSTLLLIYIQKNSIEMITKIVNRGA